MGAWTGTIWHRIGTGGEGSFCKCGDEFSVPIKCREFLDQLSTCQLLRKASTPWSQLLCKDSATVYLVNVRKLDALNYAKLFKIHNCYALLRLDLLLKNVRQTERYLLLQSTRETFPLRLGRLCVCVCVCRYMTCITNTLARTHNCAPSGSIYIILCV